MRKKGYRKNDPKYRKRLYALVRRQRGKGQLKRMIRMAKAQNSMGHKKASQQIWQIVAERAAYLKGVQAGKRKRNTRKKKY